MRILVALMAAFMVSIAVANGERLTGFHDDNDDGFTNTEAKCQAHAVGPSGPIYACKDLKTGKVVSIECKVPPAMKMPKELSGSELQKICSEEH